MWLSACCAAWRGGVWGVKCNCALPPKKALATRSPYSLLKYMFLDLPQDVIRSVARFRLRVHTLRFETAT